MSCNVNREEDCRIKSESLKNREVMIQFARGCLCGGVTRKGVLGGPRIIALPPIKQSSLYLGLWGENFSFLSDLVVMSLLLWIASISLFRNNCESESRNLCFDSNSNCTVCVVIIIMCTQIVVKEFKRGRGNVGVSLRRGSHRRVLVNRGITWSKTERPAFLKPTDMWLVFDSNPRKVCKKVKQAP